MPYCKREEIKHVKNIIILCDFVHQIQAISQYGDTKLKGERASIDIDTHGIFSGE